MKIQLKESKKSTAKKVESKQDISENQESEEIANIYDKLVQIKNEAEKESAKKETKSIYYAVENNNSLTQSEKKPSLVYSSSLR